MANCPSPSFLHSSNFFIMLSHCLSLITIPVNVYGAYLLVFKSGKPLKNVKWEMLNSQFWTSWSNLLLTTLLIPVIFFPLPGGYPFGFFTFIGMSTLWQMIIGVGSVAQVGASMIIIFENQQNHLVTGNFKFKSKTMRRVFALVNQVAGFTFFIPALFRIPNQEMAKKQILEWFECPPPEFFAFNIFILADEPILVSCLLFFILTFYVSEAIFFIGHTFYHLIFESSPTQSTRTKILQRKFFISVCVQVFLPFAIIGLPVAYIIFSVATGYHNQMLNNLCIILIGLHGSLATVSTVLVYEHMRNHVCCKKQRTIMFSNNQSI